MNDQPKTTTDGRQIYTIEFSTYAADEAAAVYRAIEELVAAHRFSGVLSQSSEAEDDDDDMGALP